MCQMKNDSIEKDQFTLWTWNSAVLYCLHVYEKDMYSIGLQFESRILLD